LSRAEYGEALGVRAPMWRNRVTRLIKNEVRRTG
jgi:hypothetical protein